MDVENINANAVAPRIPPSPKYQNQDSNALVYGMTTIGGQVNRSRAETTAQYRLTLFSGAVSSGGR
jgi:hypothetical protein